MEYQKAVETTRAAQAESPDARKLLEEMIAGGAAKSRIAEELGVSNITVATVASGATRNFRKMDALQILHNSWKSGEIDLVAKRGRRPKAEGEAGVKADTEKRKPGRKKGVKAAPTGKKQASVSFGELALPNVTDQMIADAEAEIETLTKKVAYMKDIRAIQKKYEG